MIIWDDSMSTGIPRLDTQHKMLFQKFNEFSATLARNAAIQTTGEVLDFLQFYSAWHFEQEENCMDQYKCPVAAKNKDAHAKFLSTLNQFYVEWQTGDMTPQLIHETHTALESWLVAHIGQIDTDLRSCIKG